MAVLAIPISAALASPAHASTTITWTNRGDGTDGFDTIFDPTETSNADEQARALVDAAIDHWERVVNTLARPLSPSDDSLEITVNMNPGTTATSCGGGAQGNFDGLGYPADGGNVNLNGNAGNWFVDPTPNEHSEFTGNIDNAFSGDAQTGSPAAGQCDLYTVMVLETTHILGISSNAASRYQTGDWHDQLTTGGTVCSGPGNLYRFTGPSITHLMSSNNGGSGGTDRGVPVHTAEPCDTNSGLTGANDSGNAVFEGSRRYLVSPVTALILKDVYNFAITPPETFGSFYTTLNSTTGNLLVRGGENNDTSADVITITQTGGNITTSVDIGNDIAGTGPTDAFVSTFPPGQVQSITVNAGDGNDTVTIANDIGMPVTVNGDNGDDVIIGGDITINGGAGNDQISGSVASDILSGDAGNDTIYGFEGNDAITGGTGNDTIYAAEGDDNVAGNEDNDVLNAGPGNNTVSDGSGADTVDLTQNSRGVFYATGGGNDTVLGTSFDDILEGSSGNDRLEGRAGDDRLTGGGGINDELFGDLGSDTFDWGSGDGTQRVEGGAGESDRLRLTTSGADNTLDLLVASGSRLSAAVEGLPRINAASVEDVSADLGGGIDKATVADLSSTEVNTVWLNGEGDADKITVAGRNSADVLEVTRVLGDITAIGGLPYAVSLGVSTADDTLVVDGAEGADTLVATGRSTPERIKLSPGTFDWTLTDVVAPQLSAANSELVVVDGGGGGTDVLELSTAAGPDPIALTPGVDAASGAISVAGRVPVSFRNFSGAVELLNGGGTADSLIYSGTPLDDAFSVGAGSSSIHLNDQVVANALGVSDLVLSGEQGDDSFDLPATLPFASTTTRGGDSIDGDATALTGATGAVTLDSAAATVSGYGGVVKLQGLESLSTAQSGGPGTDLTVLGAATADTFEYSPSGADSGSLGIAGFAPGLSFSGSGGQFSIDPLGGSDSVDVLGTLGNDLVNILAAPVTTVQMNATKTVAVPQATTERLMVESDQGSDAYDVTVYDTVSGFLTLFGDTPSAKRFSDKLTIRNGVPAKVQYSDVKSHTFEEGSAFSKYKNGAITQVDYFGVESIKFIR